jgi:tetratricopeptide (TPR) repeat protein
MSKVRCCVLLLLFSFVVGCSGGGGGGGPDPDPPRIVSGPSASGIEARQAKIQWSTDKNANSKVLYGETSSYTDSIETGALVVNHSITLSALKPLTQYHYKITSEDAGGRSVSSGDRTFTTLAPTDELLDQGWGFFEQAQLDSALVRFEDAYSYEPGNVAVLEGLGWTLLRLYRFESGGGELSARSVLEDALSRDPGRVDCMVALGFVYHAIELYGEAIEIAEQALTLAGDGYVFTHDADVGQSDVRYYLILSLVATGDFSGALYHSKIIDPTVDIDPEDASTWSGYSSFEEAVIVMVEGLRELV